MNNMNNMKRKGEWLEIHLGSQPSLHINEGASGSKDKSVDKDADGSVSVDWITTTTTNTGAIETFLLQRLRVPLSLINKLQRNGGIQQVGERLRIRLFPEQVCQFLPEWAELDILYEDDYCLVVNKPAGLAVHPAEKHHGGTLANAIAAYYQYSGQAVSVRHIHRLDENTSGPVLYAKNEFAHLLLDEAMRRKEIGRNYVAVVSGNPIRMKGTLSFPIGRDRHHKTRRRVSVSGEAAVTHYEVVELFADAALVRLRLETGKTHQIRVHMSHFGHPVLGDRLYGNEGSIGRIDRQALHGEELQFPHPLTKELVRVTAPWPADIQALVESWK